MTAPLQIQTISTTTVSATGTDASGETVTVTETVVKASFLRRRVILPAKALLTQGLTPDAIAKTIAIGTSCSLFPFVGTTTALNLIVGLKMKLNQPILQTLNQLLGPLQLVCILLFVRIGEVMWGHPKLPISVPVLLKSIKEHPRAALDEFAWTAVHAASAWLVVAPVLALLLFLPLRLMFRRIFAKRLAAEAASAASAAGAAAASAAAS